MGLHAVVTPLMQIRPAHASLPPAADLQAVVAASGNAVTLPEIYRTLPLLAVGEATAARARAAGFTTVHSADGDANDLADLAGRLLSPSGGPILLATGRGQGAPLAAALRRHGLAVQRRAVYTTISSRRLPPEAILAIRDGLHAALFFSAETARLFVRLLPKTLQAALHHTEALAIAPAAAEVLRALPWRSVRVAVRPTQDGVLALL
jgi:uroporphyrinogen-III synthase